MRNSTDKSIQASALFDKYAKDYEDKFMNVDLYKDSLDTFCNLIHTKEPKLLDLACGPGNLAKYLLDKRPDFNLVGIDLSPNMIAAAQRNNPNGNFKVMDCRDISSISERYDAVICSFCLPYLSREEVDVLLSNISDLITAAGVIYISTMEGDYSKSGYETGSKGDLIFMHYYNEATLTTELKKNGFKSFKVSRFENTVTNGKQVVDLIIISRK